MSAHMVSAEDACNWFDHEGNLTESDLAHTVVQQAEQIASLVKVATGQTSHLFEGGCPDALEGDNARDPECPVCVLLIEVGA